jgi:hypothetical protein
MPRRRDFDESIDIQIYLRTVYPSKEIVRLRTVHRSKTFPTAAYGFLTGLRDSSEWVYEKNADPRMPSDTP